MKLSVVRGVALLGAAVLAVSACTSSAATASPASVSPTPAAASMTPAPTPTAAPSASDVFAPSPLPAFNTGVIFKEGECWDLDSGGMVDPSDPRCDVRHDASMILQPMNGALMSGSGRMAAPSLATCVADAGLLGDRLAPNTDIYLCLETNLGVYGFLVQRPDAPGAPADRLILDYHLYR